MRALAATFALTSSVISAVPASATKAAEVEPRAEPAEFALAERIGDKVEEDSTIELYVSFHDLSSPLVATVLEGVERGVRVDDADARLIGPPHPDAELQSEQLELVLGRADGIAVSPGSAPALVPVIDRAIEMGVPVVTFGSDSPASARLAFVGEDLVESGRVAGRLLADALGNEGRVLLTTSDAAATWSRERERGAREVFATLTGIDIAHTLDAGSERGAMDAAIDEAMRVHGDIDGVLALGCCTTPAVGSWVRRHDAADRVHVVGFELLEQTIELVADGAIDATVAPAHERQALEAVTLLGRAVDGKPIRDLDTGVTVYTTEDIYDGL